jgi:hypothetical protein
MAMRMVFQFIPCQPEGDSSFEIAVRLSLTQFQRGPCLGASPALIEEIDEGLAY